MSKTQKTKYLIKAIICLACLFSGCQALDQNQRKQAESLKNLGEAYLREGDFNSALRTLLEAQRLMPRDAYIQNDMGLAYLAKKRPGLAIDHFKKAIRFKNEFADATNNLGIAYLESKNYLKAIQCFNSALKNLIYATPHIPLANLGRVYLALNEPGKAIDYYQKALELVPDFAIAHRGLGEAFALKKNYRDAIDAFKTAIHLAPRFAEAHFELAKVYAKVQRHPEAVQHFHHAIRFSLSKGFRDAVQKELDRTQPFKMDYRF